jgi:hypothetical protein
VIIMGVMVTWLVFLVDYVVHARHLEHYGRTAFGRQPRGEASTPASQPRTRPKIRVLCPAIWGTPVWRSAVSVWFDKSGCQSKLTGMDIEKLSVDVSSDDPAVGLRASLALHRLAERVEAHHVASAREKGWSWQQIGDALGVTRQSVHTKYNKESS